MQNKIFVLFLLSLLLSNVSAEPLTLATVASGVATAIGTAGTIQGFVGTGINSRTQKAIDLNVQFVNSNEMVGGDNNMWVLDAVSTTNNFQVNPTALDTMFSENLHLACVFDDSNEYRELYLEYRSSFDSSYKVRFKLMWHGNSNPRYLGLELNAGSSGFIEAFRLNDGGSGQFSDVRTSEINSQNLIVTAVANFDVDTDSADSGTATVLIKADPSRVYHHIVKIEVVDESKPLIANTGNNVVDSGPNFVKLRLSSSTRPNESSSSAVRFTNSIDKFLRAELSFTNDILKLSFEGAEDSTVAFNWVSQLTQMTRITGQKYLISYTASQVAYQTFGHRLLFVRKQQ